MGGSVQTDTVLREWELLMAVTTELTTLHRTIDELREIVASVRQAYGDIPAVKRLLGDIERIDLDASELDDLTPLAAVPTPEASEIHVLDRYVLDDTPHDPSLWKDADDEGLDGLGGYHR
jgi:hypothetical protein